MTSRPAKPWAGLAQITVQAVAAGTVAVLLYQAAGLRSWVLVLPAGGAAVLAGLPFIWYGTRQHRKQGKDKVTTGGNR